MSTPIRTIPQCIDYTHWYEDAWIPGTLTATLNSTPINLSTYTATLTIVPTGSTTPTKVLTSPSGGITLTSLGVITITMTAAEVAAIPVGDYKYRLKMTNGSSVPKTYTYGQFTIVNEKTINP